MLRYFLPLFFVFIILLGAIFSWRWVSTEDTVVAPFNNTDLASKTAASNPAVPTTKHIPIEHNHFAKNPLATLFNELEAIRSEVQGKQKISPQRITNAYHELNKMVSEKRLSPLETVRTKQWLIDLLAQPNSALNKQFDMEMSALKQQTINAIKEEELNKQNNPNFQKYKKEEARLTQEVLQKYPHNAELATQELEQKLNLLRAQIYQTN